MEKENRKKVWIYIGLILLICLLLLLLSAALGWVRFPSLFGTEDTTSGAADGTSGILTSSDTTAAAQESTRASGATAPVSGTAAATTGAKVTTVTERNMDDDTVPGTAVHGSTSAPVTMEPVDPTSASHPITSSPEGTTSPEGQTTSPEKTTSSVSTRTPGTTRSPYDTTRSPEPTHTPETTRYMPDPALTIEPPTTTPDGKPMHIGAKFDATLIAPDGTAVEGYWTMVMQEAIFIVSVPELAIDEKYQGWQWVSGYHILRQGLYVGSGYGAPTFYPYEQLPPFEGTAGPMDTTPHTVESGTWW